MGSPTLDVQIVAYDVGVRRLAIVSVLVVGAGCADDASCPSTGQFALTAPDGFAQLGPTGTVTVAWTSDGDPVADLALRAIAADGVADVALAAARLGDGQLAWDGTDGAGARVPAANYRVGGAVAATGGGGALTITPDDLHLIVVMGVRLPTQPIDFTGAQADRAVTVTTVSRVSAQLELAVDPDPAVDGDELVFARAMIPGEFTPMARSYPFPGTTVADGPIPAAAYDLIATFGGARTRGPRLTWTP